MITARFTGKPIASASISGHAGFADYGHDVVCAAVTSAVQQVSVLQDKIVLTLPGNSTREAQAFLEALRLHLTVLSEDYPGTIEVFVSEV